MDSVSAADYRKKRKAMHLTQDELAQKLGINRATVNRRERGIALIPKEAELAIDSLVKSHLGILS